jgi:hypothetical protein
MAARNFPDLPYLGLAQYDAEQSLLFAGRDSHVDACAEIAAQNDTRILLLHGQTGCGKSSFLRAGLIPALEDGGFGYVFVRKPPAASGEQGAPVFVRSGKDPLESLARALYEYVSRPVTLRTARGPKEFDVSRAALGCAGVEQFVQTCRDPDSLFQALTLLSEPLTHTLMLVLDQMEEVLTLNSPDSDNRRRFFTFLKLFNNTSHHVKLILSLRKDHSGEFIGLAQLDNSAKAEFKVYLLPEMTRDEVLSAIVLPTSRENLGEAGSPFDKYRFRYDTGVAERIVEELFDALPRGGVLPVMQIVCRDLYESVRKNPQPWLITSALYEHTRVEGSIRRHVANSLREPLRAANVSEVAIGETQRRWMRVLYPLLKYEGDGRVATGFMSRDALAQKAKDLQLADFDRMINYLARPDVLVLRRVSVPGAGLGSGSEIFGLGHDVVGLALHALQIADEAIERAERRRRKRLRLSYSIAAGITGVLMLVVAVQIVQQQRQLRKTAAQELDKIHADYAVDAQLARDSASSLLELTADIYGGESARRVRDTADALERAWPFAETALTPPDAEGVQSVNGLLDSVPGLVTLDASGKVRVHRINADAGFEVQRAYQLRGAPTLTPQSFLTASEPYPGQILLLLSTYSGADPDERFRVYLLRGDDTQAKGPFGPSWFLRNFELFRYRDTGQHISSLTQQATVSSISLAGEVISLATSLGERQLVVSLTLDPEPVSNFFAPSVDLAMEVPRDESIPIRVPEKLRQMIIGGRLFSAKYLPVSQRISPPQGELDTLQGYSLRTGQERGGAAANAWSLRIADIPAVDQCTRQGVGRCVVDLLPSPAPLQLLKLTVFGTQPNSYSSAAFHTSQASYVVVDSETGDYQEVSHDQIEMARKDCRLFSAVDGFPEMPAMERLLVFGVPDDFIIGYRRPTAIELVRVRAGQATCTEKLLTDTQLLEWRFHPGRDLLVALTPSKAIAWKLPPTSAEADLAQR